MGKFKPRRHRLATSVASSRPAANPPGMIHLVEFMKDEKLIQPKPWDLGLDAAKQHATRMAKPYGATSVRVLDSKRKQLFLYTVPS
jgi:hypothetical protein